MEEENNEFDLKKFLFGKINRKFGFIFFIMLILILIILGGIYFMQQLQKTDGAIIDAAGRNRMLSQRIGFYAEQVLNGDEIAKQTLKEIINLHHTSFYVLKEGGIVPGIANNKILPQTKKEIIPFILKSEELWLDYKKNAEIIVNEITFIEGELNPTVKKAMIFIEENGQEMLNRNNEIVKEYVQSNEKKQLFFNYFLIIFFIISLLTISFIGFFISRSISKPIINLKNEMINVRGGKPFKDITINGTEEMNSLSDSYNEMMGSLAKKKLQLEKFAKVAIGREKKMIELKKRLSKYERENK